MIVGFGRAPLRLVEELRKYADDPRILLWPEFFDAKQQLINRNYAAYIRQLLMFRNSIVIALWPDWYYRLDLARYLDIAWIFPMHSLNEIDFVLRLDDHVRLLFLGYPSARELRDYSLETFLDVARELGLPTWYLGASSREVREAVAHGFDGVDVTTLSIPGWGFRDNRRVDSAALIATWLKSLADGKVLEKHRLLALAKCRPLVSFEARKVCEEMCRHEERTDLCLEACIDTYPDFRPVIKVLAKLAKCEPLVKQP